MVYSGNGRGPPFSFWAVLLVWFFLKVLNQDPDSDEHVSQDDSQPDVRKSQVENLPFQLDGPPPDLLSAARQAYEDGDYRQAIIFLFGYQLIRLDNIQAIHLTKGKTNRQYLRELAGPNLRGILARSMVAFEEVFFGGLPLEQAAFESCWNDLEMFHEYTSFPQ